MCDWEGCTTGTIGLPNPNQRRVVKTSGLLHPYIYRYTARAPRDRFLAFEGEGMTWMRQPSRQGIALFSVRMEFWRSTGKRYLGLEIVFVKTTQQKREPRPIRARLDEECLTELLDVAAEIFISE